MADTRLAATVRYRLLATVCTCADNACSCWRPRQRGNGVVHCPFCQGTAPTLTLDARGAELRANCSAGCDPERVQALTDGNDGPLLSLYGDGLSQQHARLLLDSAVAPHVAAARPYSTIIRAAGLVHDQATFLGMTRWGSCEQP